jgi:amino acid transporter
MATYVLPTACTLAAIGNWPQWHTGYFSDLARAIGGPKLAFVITASAAVMNLSILNASVLTTTRMPAAMAVDGYLSPVLGRLHPRYGTPWIAILLSAAIYCALAWHSMLQLISIYIWLRVATSVLTVLSVWQLRRAFPDMPRTFRIPWGRKGLAYAVLAPLLMSGIAMIASDKFALRWGPVALLVGPVAYVIFHRKKLFS